MIKETVSLLTAFAADSVNGVNELAGSLPRANTGSLPDDPAPPVVSIYSDQDNRGVAEDMDPPSVPALVLWGADSGDILYKGYPLAKSVTIAAAYITAEDANPLAAVVDCGYILRGARIAFLGRFNTQRNSSAFRELNGIRIIEISKVHEHRVTAAVGRRKMWGWLEIVAIVVETFS